MSTQVRDLLDRFTADPSAVDDYITHHDTRTLERGRASYQQNGDRAWTQCRVAGQG
jgi:hypothetical protein